jgi:hypothetical protein
MVNWLQGWRMWALKAVHDPPPRPLEPPRPYDRGRYTRA